MPEELSNHDGQLCWQASYKTWGSAVTENWEVKELTGGTVHKLDEGEAPKGELAEQNLRFQGQYLDRDTGLHHNTFQFYDPDIERFISPDPIGLAGGLCCIKQLSFAMYECLARFLLHIDARIFLYTSFWRKKIVLCNKAGLLQKKTAGKITNNAKNGKVIYGEDCQGRLEKINKQKYYLIQMVFIKLKMEIQFSIRVVML